MRLTISTNSLTRGGGMERYARDIIDGFLADGADIAVITRKVKCAVPGCEIHRIPCGLVPRKLREAYFSWRVGRLKKSLSQPVHTPAHIACCVDAAPDVAICGGTHIGFLKALGKSPGLFDRLKIRMENSQYRNAKLVVAHSKLMRDELETHYRVQPEKIHVVYPPVNKDVFTPLSPDERHAARRRLGFADGRLALVFPSGSHKRKGLPFLKKFLSATSLPVDLHVAGRPAEEAGNIKSLGYVDDMRELYAAADATILASAYEPFGLVGVESLLCGTPVLYADNIGGCEALRPPGLATFSLRDPASLEHAVASLMGRDRDSLTLPADCLTYDCGVTAHVKEVKRLMDLSGII